MLGRLRMESVQDDCVIQIYNSPEICSLVINGEVVDIYNSVIATRFTLKGAVHSDGVTKMVEAKMGFMFMRLYYDGKLIGKKFMGFG